MKPPSLKRQKELVADIRTINFIYSHACEVWGKEKVDQDLTRIWDMRCIMGMHNQIPFCGGLVSKNMGEVLWVAEELCYIRQTPRPVKGKRYVQV